MANQNRFKNLEAKLERRKLLGIFDRMSILEKSIFFALMAAFAISALLLFKYASDALSTVKPVSGGTLREGVVGYPRYVNPLLPVTDSGRDLSTLIYSGLMKSSPDGKLGLDLAKSYTVTPDGLTYTFILKDNLSFQDNTPLTAYDIEFTVKKVTDPVIKSPLAVNWVGVTAKAIDQKTIQFTLKKPYAPFIENLTLGILPQHIWKNVDSDAFLFSEFNIEPVGSGPYKIKDIKRNASGLPDDYHLVPFNKYALGEAYISDLYVYFYTSEDDLVNAYKNNQIDSMSSISPENAASVDHNRSDISQTPLPRTYAVFFNQNQSKVLADKNVRMALQLATPENQIIQSVLLGFGTPINGPLPKVISALPAATTTDVEGLTEAKALLAKNGWVLGSDGVLVQKSSKGTTTATLSFSLKTSNAPELKATAELLKASWAKIGAKVDVEVFDSSDLEQNIIVPRAYDALLFGEATGRNIDLYAFWDSAERNSPGLNIAEYTNPKADKDLEAARTTSDDKQRTALYQDFEKQVANDIPAIFLYSPDLIYVLPKGIQGVALSGITESSERFSNIEKWYIETEKVW